MGKRSHEVLIQSLAADLRPVRRLWAPWKRSLAWLALCVAIGVGLVAWVGGTTIATKFAAGDDDVVELLSSALTAGFAVFAAFSVAVPGRSPLWALLPLPTLVSWIVAGSLSCWLGTPPGFAPASLAPPQTCFRVIVLLSLPLSAALFVMQRRTVWVQPRMTVWLAGLASATGAATLLSIIHPVDDNVSDLVANLLAVLAVMGMNWLMTGRLLARSVAAVLVLAMMGPAQAAARRPVVVELFTSQGCSSCPPADALLTDLAGRADVLPLAFHVDYWNRLGWTDPFSAPGYTARQRFYAAHLADTTIYTPELVVDGAEGVVGSDAAAVAGALEGAARTEWAAVSARRSGGMVTIEVGPGRGAADVLVVGYDPSRVTPVGRGENGGRTLRESNVVRGMADAGAWDGGRLVLRRAVPAGERTAVLLQAADGRIVGAAVAVGP